MTSCLQKRQKYKHYFNQAELLCLHQLAANVSEQTDNQQGQADACA